MASADAIDYLSRHAVDANRVLAWPTIGRGLTWGPKERAEGFSAEAGGPRKIIHIDMDAFYASVEQRDNPELRGKPVAVGGSRERGVVAAASYEARKFGVHSAMPSITAKRKCPDLIFVKPRFDAYKAISLQIREIFAEYTPIIEPLSLDEAYLDVTENLKGIISATQIAEEIRAKIRAETAAHGFGRRLLQQVPRQTCLRSPQAGRALRHHSQNGAGIRRDPAGQEVSRRRACDSRQDGPAGDQNRARPQGADPGLPAATFRESGFLLLLGCARRRRAACPCRSDTKIGWRREHVSRRSLHLRSRARCAPRDRRQGVGATARAPVFAAAQSRSRSSSPTSSRSREAAPVRRRSGREANSNSSATRCSNLSFLSRKVFGSWVSPCLHSGRKRLNASPNSPCPLRFETKASLSAPAGQFAQQEIRFAQALLGIARSAAPGSDARPVA